ncbi:hypothetical protein HD597_012576 [Nonomuraea thailandensis]|uniref:Uncharacterized protein n=1 Tax=Nonomuraea thailandensis TaxID=1188745 RepID=A0A9X2GUW6_9ACTN|nr:SH3 domain-containing protein [Nonomuraea thailandensis]MCP2365556.1 hypothetical protein [Nonomuraea thailandensis]
MRTTITKLAIAGATGVTGLLGAAATAQADVGTGQVRTQADVVAGQVQAPAGLAVGQVRAQADTAAGQVRAQVAQPIPDDDDDDGLRVADPEGAPVRAGPGPAYEVVDRMNYGDPVQYDETTGYVEMTEQEAAQIAELLVGDAIPGAAMPATQDAAQLTASEAAAAEMAAGQMTTGQMTTGDMPSGEMATDNGLSGDSAAHDVYSEMTADDLAPSIAVPAQPTTTYPAAYVVQQVANALGPSTSESAWLNVDNGYVWLGDVEPD